MNRRNECGNLLPLGAVLLAAMILFSWLIWDIGRFYIARDRFQRITEVSTLGSARMRIEGLQKIAARWQNIGAQLVSVDAAGRVFVHNANIPTVSKNVTDLSRALSGYQARATSIISVLAQANHLVRDDIAVVGQAGTKLDVHPESGVLVNEVGIEQVMPALWYRRLWAPSSERADPAGQIVHAVSFQVFPFSKQASSSNATVMSTSQLRWNASDAGNGGYPRQWSSAVSEGQLRPHRTASYRAVLVEQTP